MYATVWEQASLAMQMFAMGPVVAKSETTNSNTKQYQKGIFG